MLNTKRAYNGMVVAPHHLAAQAGLRVLHEGGNAVEANDSGRQHHRDCVPAHEWSWR